MTTKTNSILGENKISHQNLESDQSPVKSSSSNTTSPIFSRLRVALVHDWLTGMRGGEKVLEAFCEIFPQAEIFTLFHFKGRVSPLIESHKIHTSFLQPWARHVFKNYRYLLPAMPLAIESFKINDFDIVISSSHCVAKGVRIQKGIPHICYCHSPMRYIWDQYESYFERGRASLFLRLGAAMTTPYLRKWDIHSSSKVTHFVANSTHVRSRISKIYQKTAHVIYPPVNTQMVRPTRSVSDTYFLCVSALVPYKRIDLAIKAFNKLNRPLKIIGSGPEENRLKSMAKPHISFLGWQNEENLLQIMSNCEAVIFPGEEDFGIVPVESLSCGRPVIAYARGGALETLENKKTGLFFQDQTVESLIEAVHRFKDLKWDKSYLIHSASRFRRERFIHEMSSFIETIINPS